MVFVGVMLLFSIQRTLNVDIINHFRTGEESKEVDWVLPYHLDVEAWVGGEVGIYVVINSNAVVLLNENVML